MQIADAVRHIAANAALGIIAQVADQTRAPLGVRHAKADADALSVALDVLSCLGVVDLDDLGRDALQDLSVRMLTCDEEAAIRAEAERGDSVFDDEPEAADGGEVDRGATFPSPFRLALLTASGVSAKSRGQPSYASSPCELARLPLAALVNSSPTS